jgi:SPP1 family phage portal protein
MATLEEILSGSPEDIVKALQTKPIELPAWDELNKEYDPNEHPVITDTTYADISSDGNIEKVTRVTLDLQRLAAKRTTELCFGIPVKRIYNPQTDGEKEVANAIESILKRNRIESVNIERGNMLFASCETATLWYATEEPNTLYGFESKLKLRCRSYSPMNGDSIYPLFDAETNDMVALSFGYVRKEGDADVEYLDVYTADKHIRYKNDGEWIEELQEQSAIGKIPAVYCYRPTPAWEDTSNIVYEIEWALSRNGNYLRKNSKPIIVVFADEQFPFNQEKNENSEFKAAFKYPKGSDVRYVTWEQAVENLKYYIGELRQSFFTQLQLPDWSYESMKSTPMSGEARKQMFIDAQLKVKDESGRLLEMLDREVNVIKAFLKIMMSGREQDIDNLQVTTEITPFTINDDKEIISNIMTATGGKPVMSQREGIGFLGWSENVDETMRQIQEESNADTFEPTI